MINVIQTMKMRLALGVPSLFDIFLWLVFRIEETFVRID
jgi:hypothetical protein